MTEQERRIITRIDEARCRIGKFYEDWASRRGETYYVSCVFYMLSRHKLTTQSELCAKFCAPKQTISAVVKRLVEGGYVQMRPDRRDGRQKTLHLTEKGVEYAESLSVPMDDCLSNALVGMDIEALAGAAEQLEKYAENLNAALIEHVDDGRRSFL